MHPLFRFSPAWFDSLPSNPFRSERRRPGMGGVYKRHMPIKSWRKRKVRLKMAAESRRANR